MFLYKKKSVPNISHDTGRADRILGKDFFQPNLRRGLTDNGGAKREEVAYATLDWISCVYKQDICNIQVWRRPGVTQIYHVSNQYL